MKDVGYRALIASPAVADGYVVFGTLYNQVVALRERDGHLIRQRVPAIRCTPRRRFGGWAFVVSTDWQLQALRITDGSVVWKRELGGISYASPVVADGLLFVTCGDPVARVYRIDAETGKVVWEAGEGVFEQAAYAAVAVAEGHVIVAENRGRYHAFSMADGKLEWTARTGGLVNLASPLVLNGRVYAAPAGSAGSTPSTWPPARRCPAGRSSCPPTRSSWATCSSARAWPPRWRGWPGRSCSTAGLRPTSIRTPMGWPTPSSWTRW